MPEAVLIRALEPYYRIELMGNRRKINLTDGKKSNFKNLTNGPSKFCPTFDIKTSLNGIDLCVTELYIMANNQSEANREILATPRINIDYTEEYKDKLWRFFLNDSEFIIHNYRNKPCLKK
jgi:DNA-3-methyladenine glycosylase